MRLSRCLLPPYQRLRVSRRFPQIEITDCCDSCGGSLADGFETRYYGACDTETGDQDSEVLCSACIEKRCDDCGEAEWDNSIYRASLNGMARLCDVCFSAEVTPPCQFDEERVAA